MTDAPNNCPVIVRGDDGLRIGRCSCYCTDGFCPWHGDVADVLKRYQETGRLTDERDLRAARQRKEQS